MIAFTTTLDREEVLRRLQKIVGAADDGVSRDSQVIGRLSGSDFEVARAQKLGNSLFRPQFSGSVDLAAGGCTLSGGFRFSDKARKELQKWFGFMLIWIVGSSIVASVQTDLPNGWIFPSAGAAMIALGVAFTYLSKVYYAEDRSWLVRFLARELDAKVPTQ